MRRLLSALTSALLVLCTGMAVLGVVLPIHEPAPVPRFAALTAASPVRLVVHSLDIDAPVVPIPLQSDGVLEPPADYTDVGWWDDSAEPGRTRGQTVITGHSVHTGGGAMDPLYRIKPGAHLDVVTESGRMRYVVDKVKVDTHEQLAAAAQNYFGQNRTFEAGARLVLVTCADYDGTVWQHNLVVFATPLGQPIGRSAGSQQQHSAA